MSQFELKRKVKMTGTKAGGLKVKATNYQRYGKDHYRRIGAIGGRLVASLAWMLIMTV